MGYSKKETLELHVYVFHICGPLHIRVFEVVFSRGEHAFKLSASSYSSKVPVSHYDEETNSYVDVKLLCVQSEVNDMVASSS